MLGGLRDDHDLRAVHVLLNVDRRVTRLRELQASCVRELAILLLNAEDAAGSALHHALLVDLTDDATAATADSLAFH